MSNMMVARERVDGMFTKGRAYDILIVNTSGQPLFFTLNDSNQWGSYEPNWFLPADHPDAPGEQA